MCLSSSLIFIAVQLPLRIMSANVGNIGIEYELFNCKNKNIHFSFIKNSNIIKSFITPSCIVLIYSHNLLIYEDTFMSEFFSKINS